MNSVSEPMDTPPSSVRRWATPELRKTARHAVALFDRRRDVLRSTFQLNPSSSKVINFFISIRGKLENRVSISKPGYNGVILTGAQFLSLLQRVPMCVRFFTEKLDAFDQTDTTGLRIKGTRDFEHPLIKIANRDPLPGEDMNNIFVPLGEKSVMYLIERVDLYRYMDMRMQTFVKEVHYMFTTMLYKVDYNSGDKREIISQIENLRFNMFHAKTHCKGFDPERCFYEIRGNAEDMYELLADEILKNDDEAFRMQLEIGSQEAEFEIDSQIE
jgi:hypothetical protein